MGTTQLCAKPGREWVTLRWTTIIPSGGGGGGQYVTSRVMVMKPELSTGINGPPGLFSLMDWAWSLLLTFPTIQSCRFERLSLHRRLTPVSVA